MYVLVWIKISQAFWLDLSLHIYVQNINDDDVEKNIFFYVSRIMCSVLVQSILKLVLFQCEVETSFREREEQIWKEKLWERNTITENITNVGKFLCRSFWSFRIVFRVLYEKFFNWIPPLSSSPYGSKIINLNFINLIFEESYIKIQSISISSNLKLEWLFLTIISTSFMIIILFDKWWRYFHCIWTRFSTQFEDEVNSNWQSIFLYQRNSSKKIASRQQI